MRTAHKSPKYIRDYRRQMAGKFGITESMLDDWSNRGLALYEEWHGSGDEGKKALCTTFGGKRIPAYVAGVNFYVMFIRRG